MFTRPQIRQFEARETGWNVADHRHSLVGQTDDGRHSDGNDHDDECTRDLPRQPAGHQQGGQGYQPHRESGPAEVRDLANDFDELTRGVSALDAQAQHLSELTDDKYHRDTVEVADEHGSREVVRDPAQPCQPRPQERGPNEWGQ